MKDYLIEKQKEEIATIKERNVLISLSDADCERLAIKAGMVGLTVNELLQNFVGDLVDGTYSNGSDERKYADDWYNRCWFCLFPEERLLGFILSHYDVEGLEAFIFDVDEINSLKENNSDEELLNDFLDDYNCYVDEYLEKYRTADLEKEIALCQKWLKEYNSFFVEN